MANYATMHSHHDLARLSMERCPIPFRREPTPEPDAPLDFSKKKTCTQNGDHDILQRDAKAESERRQIEAYLLKTYGVNWRSYPRFEQAYEYLLASVSQQPGRVEDLQPAPLSPPSRDIVSVPDRHTALIANGGDREIASQQITTSNYDNERHVQRDRPSQSGDTNTFRQESQSTPSHQSVQSCPSLINGLSPFVGHSLLANCLMSSSSPESNGYKKENKYVRPFKAYTNELLMNPYVSFLGQQMQNGSSNIRSVYNGLYPAPPKPVDTTCQDNGSPESSGSIRTASGSSGCSIKPEFSSGTSQRSSPPGSFMPNGNSSLDHQKFLNGHHQISRDSPPELMTPHCDSSGVDKSSFSSVHPYGESPHSSNSFLHASRDSNDSEEASSSHEQSADTILNKKRGRSLPEELKDDAYWERRRKNNQAAKRSRDQRRRKEDLIALQARVLAEENISLRLTLESFKEKINFSENQILALREEKHDLQLRIRGMEEEVSRWRSRAAISSAPDMPTNSL